ncbi:MAG: hypothetical protein KJ697_03085 [Nanoarchaeota archaeon]|nr:hypothetical protein [Nanoarchaeota archaeon]
MAGSMSIKSDIMSPSASKVIEYVGPNPTIVYKIMADLLRDVFRLGASKIYEDEVKWDVTSEPTQFYGYWRAKDKKDSLTTIWIHVEVKGRQYKDKTGEVKLKIKGTITTAFKYKNPIMKALYYFYKITFYRNQRAVYIDDANKRLDNFENIFRSHLNMMRKSA